MPEPRTPSAEVEAPDAARARHQAARLHLPFEPLDAPPDDPSLWSEGPLELFVRHAFP